MEILPRAWKSKHFYMEAASPWQVLAVVYETNCQWNIFWASPAAVMLHMGGTNRHFYSDLFLSLFFHFTNTICAVTLFMELHRTHCHCLPSVSLIAQNKGGEWRWKGTKIMDLWWLQRSLHKVAAPLLFSHFAHWYQCDITGVSY